MPIHRHCGNIDKTALHGAVFALHRFVQNNLS
jgi:hypothetical protein